MKYLIVLIGVVLFCIGAWTLPAPPVRYNGCGEGVRVDCTPYVRRVGFAFKKGKNEQLPGFWNKPENVGLAGIITGSMLILIGSILIMRQHFNVKVPKNHSR